MDSKQCFYLKAADFRYTSIHKTVYVVIFISHDVHMYIYIYYTHTKTGFIVEFLYEIYCERIRLCCFHVEYVSYVEHDVNMNQYVRLCN